MHNACMHGHDVVNIGHVVITGSGGKLQDGHHTSQTLSRCLLQHGEFGIAVEVKDVRIYAVFIRLSCFALVLLDLYIPQG